MNDYRILDLFSGIGGFSLGLERAGMRTVAFCERDGYARRVLKKHWPTAWLYEDVTTLTRKRLNSDGIFPNVVCGGFPCQDISTAGKGAGITGSRSGLWKEIVRLVREIRPRYVIAENVSALRSKGLNVVLSDLASVGYDAEWHCIPASAINAPHRRDRVWVMAYAQSIGRAWEPRHVTKSDWWAREPGVGRVVDGFPGRVDRIRCLGNALVPQIAELIGRAIIEADSP